MTKLLRNIFLKVINEDLISFKKVFLIYVKSCSRRTFRNYKRKKRTWGHWKIENGDYPSSPSYATHDKVRESEKIWNAVVIY